MGLAVIALYDTAYCINAFLKDDRLDIELPTIVKEPFRACKSMSCVSSGSNLDFTEDGFVKSTALQMSARQNKGSSLVPATRTSPKRSFLKISTWRFTSPHLICCIIKTIKNYARLSW